ncbi:uncharacterized protein PgNI_11645 [Pyricularia grisea]|uniref:HNH nuclease domain-containing protein n=1 Tax=Pyricularia grisea TaxID=148305 RepID=A0A6P8ANK8_PYRGI|nr:uncharacterized protein PgNI_11645 [Pyricularia grisea]TLD03618.1 hypothetical protein PgNI_11645 [Pyricularia grisea]
MSGGSGVSDGQNDDLVITIATVDPQTAKEQASSFRPNVIINRSDSGGAAQCVIMGKGEFWCPGPTVIGPGIQAAHIIPKITLESLPSR